jgi:SAM-dependent methyltransferase
MRTEPDGRAVTYLSPPHQVRVSEQYFLNASLNHFWVARRFEIMRRLAESELASARRIAEVGCGNGIVQRQVELAYSRGVDGFDLNDFALKHNISEHGGVFCYDVHDRLPQLHERYDLVLLLDVLEHIPDEDAFVDAVLFLLSPGGRLIVNVPAGQFLYSSYDRVQGHCRRYSLKTLREALERSRLSVLASTYWGMPLVPLLLLRRYLHTSDDEAEVMRKGFLPPGNHANRLLGLLARAERIPQRTGGTSVMMVLGRAAEINRQTRRG